MVTVTVMDSCILPNRISMSLYLNGSKYSLCKTLQPFNNHSVTDLILFLNDNGLFDFLISCCNKENKIKIFQYLKEKKKY
jgi:hypothetical protein